MIKKIARWFTTAKRQAIQVFAASLAPIAIFFGLATEHQTAGLLLISAALLQFGSNLLSLVNVKIGDWGQGWAIVRGAVYAVAGSVAPALVSIGLWTDDQSQSILTGLGLIIALIGNGVAVLTSQRQEVQKVEEAAVTEFNARLNNPYITPKKSL